MSARFYKAEAGYSLVEVMVAIMLLGLAIIPMVSMFDAGLRASVVGSNNDRGRAIASEELAEIQALPFSSPDPEPASGTDNSVVETYPPSNGPAGAGDHPCTPPVPAGFDCRVETVFSKVDASGVVADGSIRTMVQATVNVTWNGGSSSYSTTTLVSKESE